MQLCAQRVLADFCCRRLLSCKRAPYHFRWRNGRKKEEITDAGVSWRSAPSTGLSIPFTSALQKKRCGCCQSTEDLRDEPLYIYGWWWCILSVAPAWVKMHRSGEGGAMWGEFKINEGGVNYLRLQTENSSRLLRGSGKIVARPLVLAPTSSRRCHPDAARRLRASVH